MIERQFVDQKMKEFQIQEYMAKVLAKAGYSHTEIQRTPLGEKIIIFTTRPGIVVGKKGDNIKKLTEYLKKKFKLENPQIEIGEVQSPMLDVQYVADRIAFSLERFGSKRFKSVGYKVLQDVMNAGAMGAEVILSGKIPSARARSWRFSAGYLKKSGDIAMNYVRRAVAKVDLKAGTIGIKVAVMPPDVKLPDKFQLKLKEKKVVVEEVPHAAEAVKADIAGVVAEAPTEVPKEKETVVPAEAKERKATEATVSEEATGSAAPRKKRTVKKKEETKSKEKKEKVKEKVEKDDGDHQEE